MDPTGAARLPAGPGLVPSVGPPPPPQPTTLREAAEGFEAIFLTYILRSLRQTVPQADPKGAPFTRRVYEDVFDQYLATHMARSGGLGLARMIERAVSSPAPATPGSKAQGAPPPRR